MTTSRNESMLPVPVDRTKILLELTKLGDNYQATLDQISSITFSEDTINQDYRPFEAAKALITRIKDLENPYTQTWRAWNEARASLLNPLKEIRDLKEAELKKLVEQIRTRDRLKEEKEEKERRARAQIDEFVLKMASDISQAETISEIVRLQKKMGSEKAKTKEYGDQHPELVEKLAALEEAIDIQKEILRKISKAAEQAEKLEQSGDIDGAYEATATAQLLSMHLTEAKIGLQEKALNTAQSVQEATIVKTVVPSASRRSWRYEVKDIGAFQKKHPEFVVLALDEEKMNEWFRTEVVPALKKTKGEPIEKDGIYYFLKENF